MSTGIGVECPAKKLDIYTTKQPSLFNRILMKMFMKYFDKVGFSVTFVSKDYCKGNIPSHNLTVYSSGNIGIGSK